jgi:tRNA pseudouridine32 synthase/23S rRNA pseudouridine746 synthase
MRQRFPHAEGPLIVHRLDMATSGLLVIALTKQAYHSLQEQFAQHEVKKRYVAILEGRVEGKGTISLPLRPDPMDRPRQVVDHEHGKEAITDYEVNRHDGHSTRIALYPRTGRTHQLRMHCAHADGLASPIRGDELYGHKAERLYLHAEEISFTHPTTGRTMTFRAEPEF